ncbi:arginase family protein [Sphingomonas sp. PB4P5]|uniref:arginase family protein n=1 Tax=Parasphingomonas puruogangriensis TaxID=3096155 RepID=UPI002FC7118E
MLPIDVIVVPFHAGARGDRVGKGPHRLLKEGLVEAVRCTRRQVTVIEIEPADAFEGEIGRTFELKRRVAAAVSGAKTNNRFPIILAGNCNTSVGVHAGLGDPETGVVWFDAHPDFNTPDEVTGGYFDGMGVATLAGQCWKKLAQSIPGHHPVNLCHLVYCGIRDFEPGQREKVEAHGIRAVYGGSSGIDFAGELNSCLKTIPSKVLIHLDLDCLDTSVGQANVYAAPGGLSVDQLSACMTRIANSKFPAAMTIASFDPDLPGSGAIAAAGIKAAQIIARSV